MKCVTIIDYSRSTLELPSLFCHHHHLFNCDGKPTPLSTSQLTLLIHELIKGWMRRKSLARRRPLQVKKAVQTPRILISHFSYITTIDMSRLLLLLLCFSSCIEVKLKRRRRMIKRVLLNLIISNGGYMFQIDWAVNVNSSSRMVSYGY
jgi:hypothetical protein